MSKIPSKDTKPEILLRKALWRLGYRYRKNYRKIVGSPDIALPKYKLAIFCDGDFWHGNNWKIRGLNSFNEELKEYSYYWQEKIKKNIARDKYVNNKLIQEGWHVIRVWESDIKKDLDKCVQLIVYYIENKIGS